MELFAFFRISNDKSHSPIRGDVKRKTSPATGEHGTFRASSPLLVTLGLDRPALDPNGFMFVNRDDATGVPKLTSGAVAEWATMVLSETLGL